MKLINYLKSLFTKSPNSPYKECARTIRRMGYKKEDEGTFVREDYSGRTMIWLSEEGVRIKVYANGYGESDFLPAPLPDKETLRSFIRRNEL
jgi:hypothetical protein